MNAELEELVQELENTADQLRAGDLSPEDAALAVERCAELAGRVGSALEAQAREPDDVLPGQEELL
jgi:exonuclease VII small subunit